MTKAITIHKLNAKEFYLLESLMPNGSRENRPILTDNELAEQAGYSQKLGTVHCALYGIPDPSSTGKPRKGLKERGLVRPIKKAGVRKKGYQITSEGIKAFRKKQADPPKRSGDPAKGWNKRYQKGRTQIGVEVAVDKNVVDALEKAHAKSQGFLLDSKLRKALDDFAMTAATRYFRSLRYSVQDHSKNHPYDLFCTKANQRLHVEVKGTQTEGESIILTNGEVRFARRHKKEMALFILHSIKVSDDGESLSGGEKTVFKPWDVGNGQLTPVSFVYKVPGVGGGAD